jgi:hypothetical protein
MFTAASYSVLAAAADQICVTGSRLRASEPPYHSMHASDWRCVTQGS